jgi:hypothetical protein
MWRSRRTGSAPTSKLTAFAEALDLALKADAHLTKQNRSTGMAKNWRIYRSRFIDPVHIAAGVAFWQAHAATLERAVAGQTQRHRTTEPARKLCWGHGLAPVHAIELGPLRHRFRR